MLRMGIVLKTGAVIGALILMANAAAGQTSTVAFGGIKADPTLPVAVTSQTLTVDQSDGAAQFTGNVLVIQGEMRLSADTLRVEYKADKSGIARLFADGNVMLVNATDAAKSDTAVYTIDTGEVVMNGGVVMSQGQTVLTAQRMVIDLKTGMGRMEGGVSTTFTPAAN